MVDLSSVLPVMVGALILGALVLGQIKKPALIPAKGKKPRHR